MLEAEFVPGRRLRRDAYVENGTGPHGLRFQSQEIEGLNVADFGDIAIATMILHDRFESEGHAVAETYRSFCVFRRHGSAWHSAPGHSFATTCILFVVELHNLCEYSRKVIRSSSCELYADHLKTRSSPSRCN